ncbi:DnaD domain protein, partial [Staphylococcus haemolyticus]|uniref:DnaD domain-containing protein n=1 Tax=Staphylococcus haemolyticus TaxID=1283 RepID=UPI0028A52A7B
CKMYLGHVKVLLGMFLSLKTLYRKRTVIWPFYFYTIIRTLSKVAIKYCKENNKDINYLIKVLKNWNNQGVDTKEKALAKVTPKKKKSNETDDVFATMKEKLGAN